MTEPSSTLGDSTPADDRRAHELGYHQYRSLVKIVRPGPKLPTGPWRITDTPGGNSRKYTATHVETGTRVKGLFASFEPWDGPLPELPELLPITVGAVVTVQPGHRIDPSEIYVVVGTTGDTYRMTRLGGEPGGHYLRGLSRQWLIVLDPAALIAAPRSA